MDHEAIATGERDADPQDLLAAFRLQLIAGRWLLIGAETVETALLLPFARLDRGAVPALALLFVYNAVSLLIVHRVPLRRAPVPWLMALDVLFVALAAYYTGGSGSPFLGQYYLIILAAALFYELPGGLAVGIAAAVIAALLAPISPGGGWEGIGRDLRNLAGYYVLVGGFTGYVVRRMKAWFRCYQESQAEIRVREVEREVARREMELGRTMQRTALPARPPQVPGLDLAVRLEPAREVGGDFYLFLSAERRVGLVVGDVMGKGLPAALIATSITYLLPALRPLADPAGAIRELNSSLHERLPEGAFVTMVLAEADAGSGTLRIWNAGHPPWLCWRAREGRVIEGKTGNPVLGIFTGCDCRSEEWPLENGDVLLLYSDGLIETPGASGELFGSERAAGVLAGNAGREAAEIVDALVGAVRQWGTLGDDLTLLVCKRVSDRNASRSS